MSGEPSVPLQPSGADAEFAAALVGAVGHDGHAGFGFGFGIGQLGADPSTMFHMVPLPVPGRN